MLFFPLLAHGQFSTGSKFIGGSLSYSSHSFENQDINTSLMGTEFIMVRLSITPWHWDLLSSLIPDGEKRSIHTQIFLKNGIPIPF